MGSYWLQASRTGLASTCRKKPFSTIVFQVLFRFALKRLNMKKIGKADSSPTFAIAQEGDFSAKS
jgi:hypothetical protein